MKEIVDLNYKDQILLQDKKFKIVRGRERKRDREKR